MAPVKATLLDHEAVTQGQETNKATISWVLEITESLYKPRPENIWSEREIHTQRERGRQKEESKKERKKQREREGEGRKGRRECIRKIT